MCDTRVLSKSSSYVLLKEEEAQTLDGSSSVVLEGQAAGAFPVPSKNRRAPLKGAVSLIRS